MTVAEDASPCLMGHLPIVNAHTLQATLNTGYVSTTGKLGSEGGTRRPLVEKTVADIFSDVLAVRSGDSLFPWIVGGEETANVGFEIELVVDGPPIFVRGDEYPVKIPVRREYTRYEHPVGEEEALDLFADHLLWNAIGKKSLGRGRSLTHQTPQEDDALRAKLAVGRPKRLRRTTYPGASPVTMNLLQCDDRLPDFGGGTGLWRYKGDERLRHLDPTRLQWTRDSYVTAEKVLEAWLMEHADDPHAAPFKDILPDGARLQWFGNYLPFGVTGRNIDVVVLYEHAGRDAAAVIELKKDALDDRGWNEALEEVAYYCGFIAKAMSLSRMDAVLPVVLAHARSTVTPQTLRAARALPKAAALAGYSISNGVMSISRLD